MVSIGSGRWLIVLSVIIIVVSSCATLAKNKDNRKELTAAVEGFNTALRWGEFKLASAFIPPTMQEQFWRQADMMEGRIRLTKYDIRHITWGAGSRPSPVIIRYRYYYTDDPKLKTETVRQVWRYSEETGNWQVTRSGLEALIGR